MQKKKRNQIHEKPPEKSDGTHVFDYKDIELLKKYTTERGRMNPRGRSGLTASEQRAFARAVKRARMLALMPFAD